MELKPPSKPSALPEVRTLRALPSLVGLPFLRLVLLLVGVSVASFFLVSASPIDPIRRYLGSLPVMTPAQREAIVAYWGLNLPPIERFLRWAGALLQGDFGYSLIFRQPVLTVIRQHVSASLALMGLTWIGSGCLGLGLGALMGTYRGRFVDRLIRRLCLVLSSVPTFWVGLVLISLFSVRLGWFPLGMSVPAGVPAADVTLGQRLLHLVLPVTALSIMNFSHLALQTRVKWIDCMESDYILHARARGYRGLRLVGRHLLPNLLPPLLTLQFMSLSELFGGSVMAEVVFSYPGLGQTAMEAGLGGDVPLLLGIVLFSALFVFTGNLLADVCAALLDPRIRSAMGKGLGGRA